MTREEYNYAVFDLDREQPVIDAMAHGPLHAGMRAPSFPLENLADGETVQMQDLWRDGLALIEFGSFT
jgi:hypothetical protein